ncbi:hypothetical protein G9C98_003318 [Cotesia typhae]|uniref:Uncharacterized protein n=1 Tax=Cotesia typhae TaxID=2053667 RepID=A0A8J5QU33_9HYME|nr:hypothetical protein G9C98_003318 [Cotesia typhae]
MPTVRHSKHFWTAVAIQGIQDSSTIPQKKDVQITHQFCGKKTTKTRPRILTRVNFHRIW